jgi:hypothetical protein
MKVQDEVFEWGPDTTGLATKVGIQRAGPLNAAEQQRFEQLRDILSHLGAKFDPAGMTLANQVNIELDKAQGRFS